MKQKVGPVAIAVAAVVLLVLLVGMYRYFFPPPPPPDTANAKGMPGYAQQALVYIKSHKSSGPPQSGMPGRH